MTATLTFDAHTHIYAVDGQPKASVTGLLRDGGLYPDYSFAEDYHRYRGSAVHAGAAILDMGGTPQLGPVPSHLAHVAVEITEGYWPAFVSFKTRTKWQGRIWECAMIDPGRGYGGCFDSVGEMQISRGRSDGDWIPTLMDVKSGSLPEMVPVQLAMYWLLIKLGHHVNQEHAGLSWLQDVVKTGCPVKRVAVRLEKNGRDTLFTETKKGESYDDSKWIYAAKSLLYLHQHVPGHRYVDGEGVGRSHLSDLNWVAERVRSLPSPTRDICMRAGENLWCLRDQYGLL